jgi:hypothetical protein
MGVGLKPNLQQFIPIIKTLVEKAGDGKLFQQPDSMLC